jgi:steroid 5-alpha reductase family enzyme
MSPASSYAVGLAGIALALGAIGVAQLRSRNANMVDPVWTITLGLLGAWLAAVGSAPGALRLLLAASAGSWALRLGLHLYRRNRGAPEDKRYARFRAQWGDAAGRNMFLFIESQTVFSALLGLPFVAIAWRDDLPPTWAIAAAIAIAIVSVVGEATADAQLARFRADASNRGKLNRRGLWGWSRHPNYFFECLHWFTYLLLLVGSTWWWVGLVPPVVMAWLLLKLSGIPMVEAQMARERPEYAEYVRTTSALIPWPPKAVA